MVLRLAAYLVEAGYFKKVTFMFYIVGHTKNAADWWFNLLKKKYRRSNVYSFWEMLEMMDEHPGFSVRAVEPNDFRAWGEYLDKYYKKFQTGTVLPNHIFTVTDDAVSTMIVKEDNMPTTVARAPQNLWKGRDKTTCRKETLRSDQPTIIPFGTIQPIKQVELFSKFRPLIPKKYQDETCPYPGDKIMNEIRVTKNAKAKERAAKKQKKNSKPSEKKKKEKKEKEMKKSGSKVQTNNSNNMREHLKKALAEIEEDHSDMMAYHIGGSHYLLNNTEICQLASQLDLEVDCQEVGKCSSKFFFNNWGYVGCLITNSRLRHYTLAIAGKFKDDFIKRRELFEAGDSLCYVTKRPNGRWVCDCIRFYKLLACQHTLAQKLDDKGKEIQDLKKSNHQKPVPKTKKTKRVGISDASSTSIREDTF